MKQFFLFILLSYACVFGHSQRDSISLHKKRIDDYKQRLANATDDSVRIICLQYLNFDYETENPDSSLKYGLEGLELARKSKYTRLEARSLNGLSGVLAQQGRFAEALEYLFEGRKLAERIQFTHEIARSCRRTGVIYSDLKDFSKARNYDVQALILDQSLPNNLGSIMVDHMILADVYETLNKPDSALYYASLAVRNRNANESLVHSVFLTLGNIYSRKKEPDSALYYYDTAMRHAAQYSDFHDMSDAALKIAGLYHGMNNRDSALYFARMAFQFGQRVNYKKSIMQSTLLLADLYDSTDARSALHYFRISNAAKDSLFGTDNIQVIQHLIGREESNRKAADDARLAYQNRIRWYALLSGLVLMFVVSWLLYRNNRQKQKANLQLQEQKNEVQSALHQLKTTQSQLIQAEKMASLGQLTAGIAHEIQNPLNFVNNFSELNDELIEEANQDISNGDLPAAKQILTDLKENGRLILHHGKRADAIVKSMLKHSRISSGKKEPVDLNALAEQYARIAQQAVRSKSEYVHSNIVTDLDPDMGLYNCSSEEIGRVLLSLLDNAFQTIQEKKQKLGDAYEPLVKLSTRKTKDEVIVTVQDNGLGISATNLSKIFQPFFTTRDPGKGTGLGLSLSYDIITKVYQGELKAETKEGVGTIFIITLPVIS